MNPKQKGTLTELQCLAALYECGCAVSLPYGENNRYDFIIDINNKLLRVQVKSSRKIDDTSFAFTCMSTKSKKSGNTRRRYTSDEIDYFATYYQNKCYLVPVNICGCEKRLHLDVCKNNQLQNVCFARDFELNNIITKIK